MAAPGDRFEHRQVLAFGSWKPVSSPSTTRTPRSGVMTRSVQPRLGDDLALRRRRRVSSARTTVVPTAITRPPVARAALTASAVAGGTAIWLVVGRLVRLQAGDAGVQRQRREADARAGPAVPGRRALKARPAEGISAEPGSPA